MIEDMINIVFCYIENTTNNSLLPCLMESRESVINKEK